MADDPFAVFKPNIVEPAPLTKAEQKAQKLHEKVEKKLAKQRQRKVHQVIHKPSGKVYGDNGGVMVPLSIIATIRDLTDDEIKFTIAMAAGISELPKGAQKHVVAALAKIFS